MLFVLQFNTDQLAVRVSSSNQFEIFFQEFILIFDIYLTKFSFEMARNIELLGEHISQLRQLQS